MRGRKAFVHGCRSQHAHRFRAGLRPPSPARFETPRSQTGTSFNYLLATAKIESDLDPEPDDEIVVGLGPVPVHRSDLARHPQAGRAGLRLRRLCERDLAQRRPATTPWTIRQMRRQIMKLRNDPTANAVMAGVLTQQNAAALAPPHRAPADRERALHRPFLRRRRRRQADPARRQQSAGQRRRGLSQRGARQPVDLLRSAGQCPQRARASIPSSSAASRSRATARLRRWRAPRACRRSRPRCRAPAGGRAVGHRRRGRRPRRLPPRRARSAAVPAVPADASAATVRPATRPSIRCSATRTGAPPSIPWWWRCGARRRASAATAPAGAAGRRPHAGAVGRQRHRHGVVRSVPGHAPECARAVRRQLVARDRSRTRRSTAPPAH